MSTKPLVEIDITTDVNEAIVRWPYGGASIGGSRAGRERYAKMFAEVVEKDIARRRLLALAEECASWHLQDTDDCGEIARELYEMLQDENCHAHLDP